MEIGKLKEIDDKPNNKIMYDFRFGKTNRPTGETFETGA